MRGKKSDPIFVSEFIAEAIRRGIETPDEIVQDAKKKIAQIDEEIKTIESKKILRSKLLDVVVAFEKQSKDKTEDAKLLPLFGLEYPNMCKFICTVVENGPIEVNSRNQPLGTGDPDPTMRFSIKQLLERQILSRTENKVVKGPRFDDYMKFVLGQ